MLSAAHNSCCLPHVSVSVYGTGPGFLLLLFSCRSAGQETVNTHSAAPTHKSEQRAALYIQIRDVRGRRGWERGGKKKKCKKRTRRLCSEGSLHDPKPKLHALLPCRMDPAMDEPEIFTLLPTPPCLYINPYKKAFYYLWGKEIKHEISMAFSPPDLCWSISPPPYPLAPPFYFLHL